MQGEIQKNGKVEYNKLIQRAFKKFTIFCIRKNRELFESPMRVICGKLAETQEQIIINLHDRPVFHSGENHGAGKNLSHPPKYRCPGTHH